MRLIIIFLILIAGGVYLALQLFFSAYAAFTNEAPVARIQIEQVSERRYMLSVEYESGAKVVYPIAGDRFLLNGEVITMKNWARFFGGTEEVRLLSLDGRYYPRIPGDLRDCLESDNFSKPEPCRTEHDIDADQIPVDIAPVRTLAAMVGRAFLGVASAKREPFDSAAGGKLEPGVVWICMTEDALVARYGDERGCASGGTLD